MERITIKSLEYLTPSERKLRATSWFKSNLCSIQFILKENFALLKDNPQIFAIFNFLKPQDYYSIFVIFNSFMKKISENVT